MLLSGNSGCRRSKRYSGSIKGRHTLCFSRIVSFLLPVQVSRLEVTKQHLQAELSDARAKLMALEAQFQQHLAECTGRQAAAAEKEASLELAVRQARNEASTARCETASSSMTPPCNNAQQPL